MKTPKIYPIERSPLYGLKNRSTLSELLKISRKDIKKLIDEKKDLNIGAYMGILMGKYRGKVDGKNIMEILKKYIK